jgi:hypothetical protein
VQVPSVTSIVAINPSPRSTHRRDQPIATINPSPRSTHRHDQSINQLSIAIIVLYQKQSTIGK